MKRAIIMGATSGIGMEVAILLASQGWKVGIAGRRTEKLEVLKNSHTNITHFSTIDVNQTDAPSRLLALVHDMGGMDLYFHSSGIGWQNTRLHADKELRTVETNAIGFTRMITAAFDWFASNGGGQIACITSIAGTKGLGAAPAYSATKRFQSHYLEALAQQAHMRHLPIRITDIRPGFVATDLIAGSSFPMQMQALDVAKKIAKAIEAKQEVVVVDWRYRLLVELWKLLPRSLWTRMNISKE